MADRHNALARYLAVAFTVLVIYASLHPFNGWRDSGVPMMDWVSAAWPRYYTRFDIAFNVAGYVPFGFLWTPVLRTRFGKTLAIAVVVGLGTFLSGTMETIQNFLPTRVPSNIDLASNTVGAFLGAVAGAKWGRTLLHGGRIDAWRERNVAPGMVGDAGLVLIGFWLLTQINPESLLFGNGDLRRALGMEPTLPFDVSDFFRIEAAIAAINTLAVGLVLVALRLKMRFVFFLVLLGMIIRALAAAILVESANAFHWITQGSVIGISVGCIALISAAYLPPASRRALAAVALLLATVLVNLAPDNPYLAEATMVWRQGHFLNFYGLTRLLSMSWPFLTLAWLLIPERET